MGKPRLSCTVATATPIKSGNCREDSLSTHLRASALTFTAPAALWRTTRHCNCSLVHRARRISSGRSSRNSSSEFLRCFGLRETHSCKGSFFGASPLSLQESVTESEMLTALQFLQLTLLSEMLIAVHFVRFVR